MQSKGFGFLGSSSTSQIVKFVGDGKRPIQFCKVDMDEGEYYKFRTDIYESKLATLVSRNEILIFMDLNDAMSKFSKIEDPSATETSRISYFTFLGNKHILIANSAGFINIFEISFDKTLQIFKYSLEPFDENRELLIYGTKALKEDFVAFLTSNYVMPGEPYSNIHIFEISNDKSQIMQDMTINMEMFKKHGYDPNLVSINLDFEVNGYPFVLAFPLCGGFVYSLDISGQDVKTKAIDVGQVNCKSLSYFEDCLFGVDQKMQVFEISKLPVGVVQVPMAVEPVVPILHQQPQAYNGNVLY